MSELDSTHWSPRLCVPTSLPLTSRPSFPLRPPPTQLGGGDSDCSSGVFFQRERVSDTWRVASKRFLRRSHPRTHIPVHTHTPVHTVAASCVLVQEAAQAHRRSLLAQGLGQEPPPCHVSSRHVCFPENMRQRGSALGFQIRRDIAFRSLGAVGFHEG